MKIILKEGRKPLQDAIPGHYPTAKIVKVETIDKDGYDLTTKNGTPKWEFHVSVSPVSFNVRANVMLGFDGEEWDDLTMQAFSDIIASIGTKKQAGESIDISPEMFVGKTVNVEVKKRDKYTNLNWLPAGFTPEAPSKSGPPDDVNF